jgi:hypothetical protein
MWTIFTRFGKNELCGLKGTDDCMISLLPMRFDLEFNTTIMLKEDE